MLSLFCAWIIPSVGAVHLQYRHMRSHAEAIHIFWQDFFPSLDQLQRGLYDLAQLCSDNFRENYNSFAAILSVHWFLTLGLGFG
jgi:hypothetical protein